MQCVTFLMPPKRAGQRKTGEKQHPGADNSSKSYALDLFLPGFAVSCVTGQSIKSDGKLSSLYAACCDSFYEPPLAEHEYNQDGNQGTDGSCHNQGVVRAILGDKHSDTQLDSL